MKKAFLVSRLHFCLEHAQRKQANPKLDSRCGVRLARNKPTCLSPIGRPASAEKNQTLPHILQLLDARQSPSYLKSTEHTSAALDRTLDTGSNVARKKAKYLSPMADAHWRSTAKHPPSGNFSLWAAFITCAKRGIAARAGHLEADGMSTSLTIFTITSDELFPGKIGAPRHISPQVQLADQTSAAVPYDGLPDNTSTGR